MTTPAAENIRFEPFGQDYTAAQDQGVFLRLPGQWSDASWSDATAEPGYYNVYRWYRAAVGAYSRRDPVFGRLRRFVQPYAYASARPTRYVDVLGLFRIDPNCDYLLCRRSERDVIGDLFDEVEARCKDLSFIADDGLRSCLEDRCDKGNISCKEPPGLHHCVVRPGLQGYAFDDEETIYLCAENLVLGFAEDTVIHEFAHSCGWKEGGGSGVPFGGAEH